MSVKRIIIIFLFSFIVAAGLAYFFITKEKPSLSPISELKAIQKPLLAYTFDNLRKTKFIPYPIAVGRTVSETDDFVSQIFYFRAPRTPGSDVTDKESGLMNIPKKPGTYPVIIMFRGFVPDDMYKPGIGTQPTAAVLAKDGYITLAPDFLGFGESDKPSEDPFESRFQTYTTAVSLLPSLSSLNAGLDASYSGRIRADLSKVGIWGHSNGGHIALATLAITGATYPTVLWAPVSKSFPYSILYYTDEADDQGKSLRKVLAGFENVYDADLFSPANYYPWIKAPLDIEQGTSDQEVPVWWSQDLTDTLKKDKIEVTLNLHPGADHNMLPSGWNDAVQNTVAFFGKNL